MFPPPPTGSQESLLSPVRALRIYIERSASPPPWIGSFFFTLHGPITCIYNCVIEKGFSEGEKMNFPYLQYSFPYLREPELGK